MPAEDPAVLTPVSTKRRADPKTRDEAWRRAYCSYCLLAVCPAKCPNLPQKERRSKK